MKRIPHDMLQDENQNFNIPLKEIVPEYYSKNRIVKWLFYRRLKMALDYVKKIDSKVLIDVGYGDGSFIKL